MIPILLTVLIAAAPGLDDLPPPGAAQSKRLDFQSGDPVVPVRLMENTKEISFSARGRLRLKLGGTPEKTLEAPENARYAVRLKSSTPAQVVAAIQIAEFPYLDKQGLADANAEWAAKGLKTRSQILGGVFGISGKVIDNRRYALLIDEPSAPPLKLAPRQAEILQKFGVRSTLLEEVKAPGIAVFEIVDPAGKVVATAKDRVTADAIDGAPLDVKQVEFAVGYDNHGFQDRAYRGALQFVPDKTGAIALINLVGLEELLKGLVPSEIFAKAHPEALKAQAVTARGEVLAKIGLKHLADPYLLCTEQHCAVYKGLSGEVDSTSAAVEATKGEALFATDGRLVDSVYSAVCGGHTENNEIVWGGVPNVSLRGRPDVLPGMKAKNSPKELREFLDTKDGPYACRVSSFAQPPKYRWEKRFTPKELESKLEALKLGTVFAMTVMERGVSGRVRLLNLSGENGATQLRGELNIRRQFGNLNSAMFEVRAEKDPKGRPTAWIFTGGGWGHGVGMCQTGAIGRAEAGQTYREILEHYYSGAQVFRIY